jgi:sulfite exporter TauE/SafE
MSLSDSTYFLTFASGLLGGFGHCIGMCGPLVAAYSVGLGTGRVKGNYLPHILYNLGRIFTYSIIGGIMGLAGSFVTVVRVIEKFQNMTMAIIGVLIIIMGLSISGLFPLAKRLEGGAIHGFVIRAVKFISEGRTAGAYFPMGIVIGFIPCGLLYTAFIAAAGAGASANTQIEGFLKGMLMLFLFGIGTAPSLFLLGRFVSAKGAWIRSRLYKASAFLMIIAGMIFIYRAMS